MDEDGIGKIVVTAAMRVHTALGAGLLESAYEACLAYELAKNGLMIERQVSMPVNYESVRLDVGYRIDLLLERKVVVEIKAVDRESLRTWPRHSLISSLANTSSASCLTSMWPT
jgi:GxxExxY protein